MRVKPVRVKPGRVKPGRPKAGRLNAGRPSSEARSAVPGAHAERAPNIRLRPRVPPPMTGPRPASPTSRLAPPPPATAMTPAMTRLASLAFSFALALALALATASTAGAQAPADAQRFLEQKHEAVERLMRQDPSPRRDQQVTRMLSGLLDYEELAKRALSNHWDGLEEAQRSEFVSILEQLVERNYRANLQRTLSFEVRYEGAEAQGDAVLVRTEARSRENRRAPPVSIDYLMQREGRGWRVFDVTVDDGLSMVQNYRRQFDRIIEREGWDGLMQRMRDRLEQS